MVGEENRNGDPLQLILIKVIARAAIPIPTVQAAVGNRPKQIQAFNSFDGTLTLTEVAKKTKLDKGNLSKAVQRWIAEGVMFRLGPGHDGKFLHVYPIPVTSKGRSGK